LENGVYSYRFIQSFLSNKMNYATQENKAIPLPSHKNIRGSKYYKQIEINFKQQK